MIFWKNISKRNRSVGTNALGRFNKYVPASQIIRFCYRIPFLFRALILDCDCRRLITVSKYGIPKIRHAFRYRYILKRSTFVECSQFNNLYVFADSYALKLTTSKEQILLDCLQLIRKCYIYKRRTLTKCSKCNADYALRDFYVGKITAILERLLRNTRQSTVLAECYRFKSTFIKCTYTYARNAIRNADTLYPFALFKSIVGNTRYITLLWYGI